VPAPEYVPKSWHWELVMLYRPTWDMVPPPSSPPAGGRALEPRPVQYCGPRLRRGAGLAPVAAV